MSEYKLVPVEPTDETLQKMRDLALNVNLSHDYTWIDYMRDLYGIAMLSASPTTDTITIDRAEYEAMKADAERYRWLKDNGRANSKNSGNAVYPKFGLKAIFSFHYWTDDLDQAIDQARKI